MVAFLPLQACRENAALQPITLIFRVILLDQLFHMGQHQNLPPGETSQLGNHQTFAGAGWQHDNGGLIGLSEMIQRGLDRVLLVWA